MGSASFMHLMEITLPQGLNVKNAVFCAIDGELAGIFALNYTLPDVVFPALDSSCGRRWGRCWPPGTSISSLHAPPAVQAGGG